MKEIQLNSKQKLSSYCCFLQSSNKYSIKEGDIETALILRDILTSPR